MSKAPQNFGGSSVPAASVRAGIIGSRSPWKAPGRRSVVVIFPRGRGKGTYGLDSFVDGHGGRSAER
eukprot:scaffold7017_cov134-Cylindrotheca_fusiformis.AAC.31